MPWKSSHRMLSNALQLLVFGALLGVAGAQTESVLYSFCSQKRCADGDSPSAGLVFDQKGNLYGTTANGGANGLYYGAVFKLTPKGKETVLHSFCAQTNCTDGENPEAGLIFDAKGNLYGTASSGGLYYNGCNVPGCGTVFKLTPAGQETVLNNFVGYYGYDPVAGVVFDQKGNLYGTTYYGGDYGEGVVFKLAPEGKEIVLYSFCAHDGSNCTDGANPNAGLVLDQKGNLYGTTYTGGALNKCHGVTLGCGVVFKITPEGKETVLYAFCSQDNCADGASPYGGLVVDNSGNLYGTTNIGGALNECFGFYDGCGVVFKITPEGKETVLHSFCSQSGCTDGALPYAGLVFDQKGNLYGTTYFGGAYNSSCIYGCGVVFKLTPKGKEIALYTFCSRANCTDGSNPEAGVILDRNGNLYGTTLFGGAYNPRACSNENGYYGCGTVFKITP